ncbi:hypothetical protein [Bifidobacterium biavatii]|uniref:PhnA protein n=1 Tax=Bifidobacterium biavatii DSM 23969 TaxID=1437608 RepID=A0A086ZU31_9BIFI|nr:hypothetical protein [Bifidobacterium biavatii]KFI50031.1 PhnA protein [Bifidobacterium biavatii DSM 23969]
MPQSTSQQHFHDNLTAIKHSYQPLCLIAARKANVMARSQGHGTRSVAPIPLNLGAWQLAQDIRTLTISMARAAGLHYGNHMDVEDLLTGIIANLPRLLARPDAPTIMALTDQAAIRLDRILNPPPDTKMIGWCPQCGMELRCDPLELASGYKACGSCCKESRIKDVHRSSMARLAVGGAQGTPAEISRLLAPWGIDVKRNTITQWAKRGRITPVAHCDDGPVYLVWDVWQVLNSHTTNG